MMMMMIVEQSVECELAEKTCPTATLSTTNPTLPDPGCHGGKPATNRLSYGTVIIIMLGLFCPLEEYVGPSILTVGTVCFSLFLGCVLKFSLESYCMYK
jgi:hypothetical protein